MREITGNEKLTTDSIFNHFNLLDIGKWPTNDRTYIFNRDGSIGKLISYQGISSSGLTPGKIQEIVTQIQFMLNRLGGEDISVQFIQRRKKRKITDIDPDDSRLTKEMKSRVEFLNKMAQEGELFDDEFFIGINIQPDHNDEGLIDTMKRYYDLVTSKLKGETPREYIERSFAGVNTRITKMDSVINSIHNSLIDGIGVEAKIIESEEEYKRIYRSFFANSSRGHEKPFNPEIIKKESLRQTLYSGIEVEKEEQQYFVMDNCLHRVYLLDRFNPNIQVNLGSLKAIVEAPFEFIYFLTLSKMTHEKAAGKFNWEVIKSRTMESETFGTPDLVAQENTNKLMESYQQWAESGEDAIQMHCAFIYQEDYDQVLKKCAKENLTEREYLSIVDEKLHNNYFGKLAQSEWRPEHLGQFMVFNRLLPGQATFKNVFLSGMLEIPYSVAHLVPLYSEKRDDIDHQGVNHFFTESKALKTFSLFDPTIPSYMALISGDMGSGKSVLLQTLLATLEGSRLVSGKPPMVRILDFAGTTGSFFKRARMVKKYGSSSHLEFHKGKKPNIQILELEANKRFPSKKKVEEVKQIIEKIKTYDDKYACKNDILDFYQNLNDIDGEITQVKIEREFYLSFSIDPDTEVSRGVKILDVMKLKAGDCVPNGEALDTILNIMGIVLSDDPQDDDDDFNAYRKYFKRDDVSELILMTYENTEGRFPYLRDVLATFESLHSAEDENGDTHLDLDETGLLFHKRLKDFTVDGKYRYFDRESDVDLSSDFILFDLYGLEKTPKLFAIYTIYLLQVIDEDMHNNHDRVRAFFMDEAALAMTGGTGKQGAKRGKPIISAIIKMARTSRKHKYAAVFASQLPTDFILFNSDNPEVLLSQARTHIFCGFGNEKTISDTVKYYSLPAGSEKVLRGLGIKSDRHSNLISKYSRFLMIQRKKDNSEHISVMRNILSPFEFQNTTSSLEENAVIKFFTDEKGMDIEDVYEYLAQEKHIGDKDLINFLRKNNYEQALKIVDRYQ